MGQVDGAFTPLRPVTGHDDRRVVGCQLLAKQFNLGVGVVGAVIQRHDTPQSEGFAEVRHVL